MVFKILQIFPLKIKGLIFQIFYAGFLFFLASVFNGNKLSLLIGFLFSQVYMLFFFQTASLILDPKRRTRGILFLFIKWILLACMLFYVSRFLEGKSFLIGLTGIFSFLLCYVYEHLNKAKEK